MAGQGYIEMTISELNNLIKAFPPTEKAMAVLLYRHAGEESAMNFVRHFKERMEAGHDADRL